MLVKAPDTNCLENVFHVYIQKKREASHYCSFHALKAFALPDISETSNGLKPHVDNYTMPFLPIMSTGVDGCIQSSHETFPLLCLICRLKLRSS